MKQITFFLASSDPIFYCQIDCHTRHVMINEHVNIRKKEEVINTDIAVIRNRFICHRNISQTVSL